MVRLPGARRASAGGSTAPLMPARAGRPGGDAVAMLPGRPSTLLGAALLLAAAAPAHAGITGDTSTTATLPLGARYTRGTFAGVRDDRWYRVQVQRGQHYAAQAIPDPAGGLSPGYTRLTLYDGRGRPLRRVPIAEGEGFEFTAAADGVVFLGLDNRVGRWARGYLVRVDRDLPADATTTAALAVGVARRGNSFFSTDEDWYRVTLSAGTPYALKVGLVPGSYAEVSDWRLAVVDARGRELARGGAGSIASFRPVAAGTYYVAVRRQFEYDDDYLVEVEEAGASRKPGLVAAEEVRVSVP